jgi:hypothetical protein
MDAAVSLEGEVPVLGSDSCLKAVTILDVSIPEKLVVNKFTGFSWAIEQLASLPDFSRWQSVNTDNTNAQEDCECAPAAPGVQWHVGSNGVAVAQEDRKAAATFERAVKMRPSIFHIDPTVIQEETRIQIGMNVASLLHRARGRLGRSGSLVELAWRLRSITRLSPQQNFQSSALKATTKTQSTRRQTFPICAALNQDHCHGCAPRKQASNSTSPKLRRSSSLS